MVKFISLFVLLLQILNAQHIYDSAGVFSSEFEKSLEEKLSSKDLNVSLFVLALTSLKNSSELINLNKQLVNAPKNPLGVVISTKHRKFWLILNENTKEVMDEDSVYKLTLLYAYPYFKSDDYENGVDNITDDIIDKFNPKEMIFDIKDFDIILFNYHVNIFLVLLVVFILLVIALKIKLQDSYFLAILAISFAVLFIPLFFTFCANALFNSAFLELLNIFPSKTISYIIRYNPFLLLIIFAYLTKVMLHRGLHLDEYQEKARKERVKYAKLNKRHNSYSSSYGSSSSSSYSGGGGSFGGGGASGSW